MREVTSPRMLPLALVLCVFSIATWQQVSASCQGKINVAVAMDASQSLGKLNFLHVKAFTKAIADHLLTDNDEANFFAVAFAREVDVIVGKTTNASETTAKLDAFDKELIPETNTNLAIDKCSQLLKAEGDPDKPSVIFIVTDGRATSGLEVVIESAKAAAADRNILVAIGVGKDFAYGELLYIAGRKEHVLNGTFANLNVDVLDKTLETICHLSVTDPSDLTIVRPTCQNDGTVAIGVEVAPSLSDIEGQQLNFLLEMMSPGTLVSLSNGEIITPFHRVSKFINETNDITSAAVPTDTMLQVMIGRLRQQQTGPKVALLIIDDTYWKTNLNNLIATRDLVATADVDGITVIALIVGRQSAGMEKVLTTIFGTLNKLSVNSNNMESVVTSGFNQLLNRICTVMSVPDPVTTLPTTTTTPVVTTPQQIANFGGALDIHLTLDICQADSQDNIYFGTYGHFTALLADKLIFGPLNVSLTTSLTYCSGVEVVARSRDYVFETHYSVQWARDGIAGIVYAGDIVNDIIEKWDNTLENVGIIFITENMVEDGLRAVVERAKAMNITLMAVTLTSTGGASQAMAQKAALIDASYVHMTYSDLYTLPGLVRTIMQRIPNLFQVPMQTVVGITLDNTLTQQQYDSVDYFLQTLRRMVNSVIKDKKYTDSLQLELFNKLEVSRRANILRRIESYNRISINNPDFVVIITNRPPLDMDLINAAINRSMDAGVKIFMAGLTGDSSIEVEAIASEIDQESKSIVILIDSSESVSRKEFIRAYNTSDSIMFRLNSTVNVEVSTFDENVNVEIPTTEYSINTRVAFVGKLYRLTHLMLKPPLYKAIERMVQMSEAYDVIDDDVRMVGVMFIADRPRYLNLLNLFQNYIYGNRSTLIVVDVSDDGNIEGLEQDFMLYPMHIIRTRNLVFDDLPRQILGFMNSTGYSKFHTIFTANQISSLEGSFNLFENMLQDFGTTAGNYPFSTDFGLITMESNALFDYFNLNINEIIYVLRKLMKVSDRGSGTALDYSSGLFEEQKMTQTQPKQAVSVIITDENPKFPNVVARKSAKARDEDGNHVLVIGVGDNLNRSSLLSLNNVGDDDLCVASDGVDLRNSCVGWLVDKLRTLPTIVPITSTSTSATVTTTDSTPSVHSSSPTIITSTPTPFSTNKPTPSTTTTSSTTTTATATTTTTTSTSTTVRATTPPVPLSTTTAAASPTTYNTTISLTTTPATTSIVLNATNIVKTTSTLATGTATQTTSTPGTETPSSTIATSSTSQAITTLPSKSSKNITIPATTTQSQTTASLITPSPQNKATTKQPAPTAKTTTSSSTTPPPTESASPPNSIATSTIKTLSSSSPSPSTTIKATAQTPASTQSTVKPFHYVCNADAHVGIGVASSLQVRDVFETLQDNITQSIGDDVKFKFLVFYNSQLFQPNTEMKSSDPKAFQSVVEEVNARLTNLYSAKSNLVALIFTDANSAADGISSDIFNILSTYIEFVVFGIGQFSDSATADLKKLTRNKPQSLLLVDNVAGMDYDTSLGFLGNAVCDAVTKIPVMDTRTNITQICSKRPLDRRFDFAGLNAENVWYPFDCTKFINCKRMGSIVTADVLSCPMNIRFNRDTKRCDISDDVACEEVTAAEYALEIGKIVDPPPPIVVNLTAECIKHCFKSGDLTDNYDYTFHPADCSKFIVCRRQGFINPGYTFTTLVESCPDGQFWNAQQKLCVSTHLAECATDVCISKSLFAFWKVDCRHFYKCDNGQSRLEHCAYGKKFQSNGYCVDDTLRTCTVPIVQPESCYNLPWIDSTMFVDRTIGENGKLTSCPLGKMYDHHTCACSRSYVTGTCQPLISKDIDNGNIMIDNVLMRNGAATFMGIGFLKYFKQSPFIDTFLVHVVVRVSKSNQDVVMLTSCQTPGTSAISLRLTNDRLYGNVGLASGTVTLTSKIQFDVWNHVYLAYNGQRVVLKTESATDQVSVSGLVQGCQDSFLLGSENEFFGEIYEFNVYDCIPDKHSDIFN